MIHIFTEAEISLRWFLCNSILKTNTVAYKKSVCVSVCVCLCMLEELVYWEGLEKSRVEVLRVERVIMKEDPVIHQREWRWKVLGDQNKPDSYWWRADGGSKPHLYYICPKSSDFSVQSLWWNHYTLTAAIAALLSCAED